MQYEYRPLQNPGDIRLLKLHVSEDDNADINGEIYHVSPTDGVAYEAVSYFWGPRSKAESTIYIAGLAIPVTDNLHAALLRFRNVRYATPAPLSSGPPHRLVWIDAVCINQRDLSERAQQVRHMRQIYQHASRVLVWLGESDDQTMVGIRFLQEIGAGFTDFYTARLQDSRSQHSKEVWRQAWAEYVNEEKLEYINSVRYGDLLAVTYLLERSWFGRAWVIQEFSVNDIVTFICGDVEIPHKELRRGFYAFTKTPLHHQVVQSPSDVHNFRHLETLVSATDVDEEGPQDIKLLKYLIASREFGAQDPRDKVFALAGMAIDGTRTPFEINYDADHGVEFLYHRVAVHYIQAGALTEVLMEAGLNYSTDLNERAKFDSPMPSWVPDWRQYVSPRRMSNNSAARQVSPTFSLSDDGMILQVRTCVLDRVQVAVSSRTFREGYDLIYTASASLMGVTEQTESQTLTESIVSQLLSDMRRGFCNQLKSYISVGFGEDTKYSNGEEMGEALRRTLYCNGKGPFTASAHITDEARAKYDGAVATWLDSGGKIPYNSSVAPSMPPYRRDFLVTEQGYMGWGPMDTRKGDIVGVIHGMPSPSIFRHSEGLHFRLLGDSYIHGMMDGEVLDENRFPPTDVYLT